MDALGLLLIVIVDNFQRYEEIRGEQGRCIGLRLDGNKGAVDIWAIFAHSGSEDQQQRGKLWDDLGSSLRDQNTCLTVVAGDFNFVEKSPDRINFRIKEFTCNADKAETNLFRSVLLDKDTHTQKREGQDTLYFCKLDRCYTSTPVVWSHTHDLFATPSWAMPARRTSWSGLV